MQAAGKIITACWKIYSAWREKATKEQREELEKIIQELQAGKTLEHRVGESLSRSLQSLRLSAITLETLRRLDSDQIFHSKAAQCLAEGCLSSEEFARLLRDFTSSASCPAHEIESVAALWLSAIDQTIGSSSCLSHALQFKSARRVESGILAVKENGVQISADTQKILHAQEAGNSVGIQSLAQGRDILELVRSLEEKISASAQAGQAQSVLQRQLQSRFEKCRERLLFSSIDIAEEEFLTLIADLIDAGEAGSSDLLFRSHLNHSSCLLLQKRLNDAKEALERARQIAPHDTRYLRHLATLLSYEGKNQEALEIVQKLRVLEPDAPKNIADEIALLHDLKRNEELARLVDEVDVDDADVQCYKAHALLQLGRYAESVEAAQKATKIEPHSEGPWIALAYSLGFPVVSRWEDDERSQLCVDDEDAIALNKAIEAAYKAENILQKRSRKSLLQELRANLLAFLILSNRHDEGELLASRMECSSSASEVYLGNLYHIFFICGKRDKLLEIANLLASKLGTEEARLKKANALILTGKGILALEELEALKSANERIVDNPMWIATASSAYSSLHQADKALSILQRGISAQPNATELHLAMGKLLAQMRRNDQARNSFMDAEKLSPKHPEVLSYFGQFLYFNGDWLGAIERFEKVGAKSPLNPLFPRFVASIFNAGRYDDCLDHIRMWKSGMFKTDETVCGVGARAAMILEDWPLAKELLEELVREVGSSHLDNLKLLAKVYLRLDDNQEAYTLLTRSVAANSGDEEALTLLAKVCGACGKFTEALECHAKCIKSDAASVNARAAFFGTVLRLPEGFDLAPDLLRLHHENLAILASHPSGVLRAVTVQRNDGEFDFSGIQSELDKNAKIVSEVLEYSNRNPMPLQFLASDLGVKVFEGWRAFTSDSERGVRMCSGTKEEQEAQLRAVGLCTAVSVDLIALFTLHGLGQIGLLKSIFQKIFVHISVLDAVVEELREALAWPSSSKLGSVNGQMVMYPPQPEERECKIRALSEIRDFLKSHKVILSGLRSTSKFASFVPDIECNSSIEEFMEPALVAHEQNAALLTDDFVQRVLSTRLKCPAFCTQALLRYALAKKAISQTEYQDSVLQMHSWNYHFVSDNQGTLLRLVEREKTPSSPLARTVVTKLASNAISSEECRCILTDFALYIWAQGEQKAISASPWMVLVWGAIEQADPSMELARRLIADLPGRSLMEPRMFSSFLSFICESMKLTRSKARKLLNYGESVANRASSALELAEHRRIKRAWQIEAKTLEILKMLWCA